jgi:hypothetical protein
MSRRPELLSSVMLRQNPHNVHEWHKRVKLFEGNPTRQVSWWGAGSSAMHRLRLLCSGPSHCAL